MLSRGEFEPLRLALKRTGIEHCELKALMPDGKRLVLQEFKVKKGVIENPLGIPHGKKRWVLVWDMERKVLKRVGLVGAIEEVFGWVGKDYLLVHLKGPILKHPLGSAVPSWQDGLLRIPN